MLVEKHLLTKLAFMLFVDNVLATIRDTFLTPHIKFDRTLNKYKGKLMFVKGNNPYDGDPYINLLKR